MSTLRINLPRPLTTASSSRTTASSDPSAFQQRLQQRAVGGAASAPPGDAHSQALDLLAAQQASNMQYLKLQSDLANPKHSVISNVLKVRHDTTKNAIANIR